MSAPESWENICCRCGDDVKENVHPGRRACHVTCGPCLYPDNPKCASCEIIGYCRLALDYFKSLRPDEVEKGRYFNEQLTGEETLFHTLEFVEGQQNLVKELGEKRYLKQLKKTSLNPLTPEQRFVPGIPRDSRLGWTRMTLMMPVPHEWVDAISRVLGVMAKLDDNDNLHIVIHGEKEKVKKAVEMFYQLQMLFQLKSKQVLKKRLKPRRA